MRFILALALVSVVAVSASEIESTFFLLQEPRPCNNQSYDVWYANPYGQTVYIVGGYGWQGAPKSIIADIGYQVYVHKNDHSGEILMFSNPWDHYTEPDEADASISKWDFGGHYFVWEPSGSLLLRSHCALVGDQPLYPMIYAGPWHGWLHPHDYYYNLGGHHQQAFAYVSFERPR